MIRTVIEKKTVIKALRTEPLKAGQFFEWPRGEDDLQDCKVCAVGAVLRRSLSKRELIELERADKLDVKNIGDRLCRGEYSPAENDVGGLTNVQFVLERKNYLGALSIVFESLATTCRKDEPTKKVREELVEFVRKNFPTRFAVEI